jgi:V/A-type H+-transporting ATPase subunit E
VSTSLEDKIELFSKLIFEKIDIEYREKREEILKRYESEKASLIEHYQNKLIKSLQEAKKKAELEREHMVSKAVSDGRMSILKKRREIMEKLMEQIKSKAIQFTQTKGYKDFLRYAIEQVSKKIERDQIVIYNFTKRDLKFHRDYIFELIKRSNNKNNFQVAGSGDDMVGGVFALSGDGRIEVDFTINTTIEESRPIIGRLLSSRLVGGVNDGSSWENNIH